MTRGQDNVDAAARSLLNVLDETHNREAIQPAIERLRRVLAAADAATEDRPPEEFWLDRDKCYWRSEAEHYHAKAERLEREVQHLRRLLREVVSGNP